MVLKENFLMKDAVYNPDSKLPKELIEIRRRIALITLRPS